MSKLPESLTELSLEDLQALLSTAINDQRTLSALSDEDLTDDKLDEFEQAGLDAATLRTEIETREAAAAARAERITNARAAVLADEEPSTETGPEDEDEVEEEVVVPDDASELIEEKEKELVTTASGRTVARAASKAPAVILDREEETSPEFASIVAAANVPDFAPGTDLGDFGGVAEAFASRTRGFVGGDTGGKKAIGKAKGTLAMKADASGVYRLSAQAQRYKLATIRKPDNEFTTGMDDSVQDQLDVLMAAAKESRLPGGSLVAAGGWCAPSETLYGPFCAMETIDGILSIPEITVRRGGINFTKGPDYATLAASWGFLQTEAQAEAGTEKTCYAVECPPFTDVRLDAIGFCITNGILTNVGYPELARRVLEIGATAHAHKVNAQVISRIATAAGAAIDYTEIGGTVTDLLGAIELSAEVIRYKYSLAIGATVEVVLPAWARIVARQDYANRNGNTDISPTDAEVTAWFSKRNLAVQWVYDWQPLGTNTAASQALPTTVNALLYPAGSFVKGTADVINLDTIYDSVNITTNTYTAAFFEEGLLVANVCAGALQVAIALNTEGASGFPAIGAGAGVTFASA